MSITKAATEIANQVSNDAPWSNTTSGTYWFFMAGQGAMPEYTGPRFETAPPALPAYFSDTEIQTATTMELL